MCKLLPSLFGLEQCLRGSQLFLFDVSRSAVLPAASSCDRLRTPCKNVPYIGGHIFTEIVARQRAFTYLSAPVLLNNLGKARPKIESLQALTCRSSQPNQCPTRRQERCMSSQPSQVCCDNLRQQGTDSKTQMLRLYRGPYIRHVAFFMRCALFFIWGAVSFMQCACIVLLVYIFRLVEVHSQQLFVSLW
jgi:hypothetical protein